MLCFVAVPVVWWRGECRGLSQLKALVSLDLRNNSLTGGLPAELSRIATLRAPCSWHTTSTWEGPCPPGTRTLHPLSQCEAPQTLIPLWCHTPNSGAAQGAQLPHSAPALPSLPALVPVDAGEWCGAVSVPCCGGSAET